MDSAALEMDAQRTAALTELAAELAEFNHDALVQLHEDLLHHAVVRGTWGGCVISYRRGAPGSCRRDRAGRARNAFTILWDSGWITEEEVLSCVEAERDRRTERGRRVDQPQPSHLSL